jgi:pimeloyl-CoA synthetase
MISKENKIAMLTLTGETLFGDRWQTDLARSLNISDARKVRQWLSSDRVIPDRIINQLLELLTERKDLIDTALIDIKNKKRLN